MRVNTFCDKTLTENRIDIYYNNLDAETQRVLDFLNEYKKLLGKNGEQEEIFAPSDVYYFERVERKCFAYLHSSVFRVDLSLQNTIDQLAQEGFVRISKSLVVNIFQIKELKSDINMRVKAVLKNGETIIVNRSYKRELYKNIKNLHEWRE